MFELHANEWKQINTFSTNMKTMSDITLGLTNDLLYVCSFFYNKIDAYTHNGVFQFTTGRYGNKAPGEYRWPRICASNASGALLIADHWNGRLQVLSATGKWIVVEIDPPVLWPWSTCIVNDTLYVTHENEKRQYWISSYKSENLNLK